MSTRSRRFAYVTGCSLRDTIERADGVGKTFSLPAGQSCLAKP